MKEYPFNSFDRNESSFTKVKIFIYPIFFLNHIMTNTYFTRLVSTETYYNLRHSEGMQNVFKQSHQIKEFHTA